MEANFITSSAYKWNRNVECYKDGNATAAFGAIVHGPR